MILLCFAGCGDPPQSDPGAHQPLPTPAGTALLEGFEPVGDFAGRRALAIEERESNHPLFEIVEDSGVDFTNHVQENTHGRLILTGSGVALGDYDNDGQIDIYLLSTDGPNQLFRGLGAFQFQDVTAQAGVDGSIDGNDVWGAGGSFADVDNDGDLDLLVANMGARNILYQNQGDGTFKDVAVAAGVDYVGASKIGSFCDYDRDGDLDFYLLTYRVHEPTGDAKILNLADGSKRIHPDFEDSYDVIDGHLITCGEQDLLYENDGTGKFSEVTEKAGIRGRDYGLSSIWFDYNNDGWLDLYVANDFHGDDQLLKNNGDGTFDNVIGQVMNHMPWFSMGSDAGDLNNDGFEDLIVVDMSGSNHYKQKVNMGEMSASSWFLTHGHPRQYMRNSLYINTGTGRFMDAAFMAGVDSTDWSWAVRFADLDLDGLQDIFVTNGHARDSNNSDFAKEINALRGELSSEEIDALARKQPPILESNMAFRNNGAFDFDEVGRDWNLDLNGVSHGVAFADFDSDGDLDMVVNNLNAPATVYRNRSSSRGRLVVDLRGSESNFFGYGAKVEIWHGDAYQQRRLMPAAGYLSSDEPILHFGLGDHDWIDRLVVTWPTGNRQELRDLQANSYYRIVEDPAATVMAETQPNESPLFSEVANEVGVDFVAEETEFDDFANEPLLPNKLSQLGPGASWGDVNNDGLPDFYVGGPHIKSGELFVNIEGTGFRKQPGPWADDFLQEDLGSVFFDADNDGDEDLYVVSGSNEWEEGSPSYRDRLYLNDGQGTFTRAPDGTLPDLTDSGSSVSAADFDQDGDLDLFVGGRYIPRKYPLGPQSRILRNEGGRFVDVTSSVAKSLVDVGLVNSAIWTDYDNDGWLDLMLAMEWGPVKLFRNSGGQLEEVTESAGLSETVGWWHGIAAGDFDRDGDLDYVATNHGLNTKYHCSKDHPHRMYYQDFDGNGSLDLVEAEYEGDCEFPVRGRSCSSNSMPFIREKFETFHDFAIAEIEDIYTPRIKEGPHFFVTDLESMVFWNDDGHFAAVPLPRITQISPSFGVTVSDFDGDGWLDIVLAQNFFGPQPETGYMDGGVGQFLRGTGTREFEPVWPHRSGVVIPGDATAATSADIDGDGDRDLMVVSNNGPVRIFRNQTDAAFVKMKADLLDDNVISVLLVGKDFQQRLETVGGEGYLGQSSRPVAVSQAVVDELEKILITTADGITRELQPGNVFVDP